MTALHTYSLCVFYRPNFGPPFVVQSNPSASNLLRTLGLSSITKMSRSAKVDALAFSALEKQRTNTYSATNDRSLYLLVPPLIQPLLHAGYV